MLGFLLSLAATLGGCSGAAEETETTQSPTNTTHLHLNASRVERFFSKNAPYKPRPVDDIDVYHCLRRQGELVSWITSLRLDSLRWEASDAGPNASCTLLIAASREKRLHVARWRLGYSANCSQRNYVTVRDFDHAFQVTDCGPARELYTSVRNVLEIVITVGEPQALLKTQIDVIAANGSFKIEFLESGLGEVKTEIYRFEHHHRRAVDSWMAISVPLGHVTLVSVEKLRLRLRESRRFDPGCARLYSGRMEPSSLAWTLCDDRVVRPDVYDARRMFFRFTGKATYLWVKLLYSFHKRSRQPARVNGGRWNCSVDYWKDFKVHLDCNLDAECEGGEDERSCYYTARCGQGLITLGPIYPMRCYEYHLGRDVSWRGAQLACQKRGGYLASLNTPAEWDLVEEVLRVRRSASKVFIGQQSAPSVLPIMYRHLNMWADKTVVYYSRYHKHFRNQCSFFLSPSDGLLVNILCDKIERQVHFLCEFDDVRYRSKDSFVFLRYVRNGSFPVPVVKCPAGHATHAFLACDEASECWTEERLPGGDGHGDAWGVPSAASCPVPASGASLPALFACSSGVQRVPYSLVCDHRRHCADDSDESFCAFAPCSGSTPLQCHASAQCVPLSAVCNSRKDCSSGSDEGHCFSQYASEMIPQPAIVHFTLPADAQQQGAFTMTRRGYDVNGDCPQTHFWCAGVGYVGKGYCLPVFLRCNGVNDCPEHHEDEKSCDWPCSSLFQCRQSRVCLHPSHVCDTMHQCPQHDDELLCELHCPAGCTCHGLDFRCHERPFPPDLLLNSQVRYLDASGSDLTLAHLSRENNMLIHLSLSQCGLRSLGPGNLTFPNLRSLDLSRNSILSIRSNHLREMMNLQYLSLSRNPIRSLFSEDAAGEQRLFPALRVLDVSRVRMRRLNTRFFSRFPGLQMLNLSNCGVDRVTGEGLQGAGKLRVLDILGCPVVHFPRRFLSGLDDLQFVRADNFKVCCPDTLPAEFNPLNCRAPFDEVSSCQSLLRSDVYVLFLSLFSALALLGNLGCFVMRSVCLKSSATGFGVFVSHLTVSDFLMGVYLAVIGVADRLYKGSYMWEDIGWRHSAACRMAGFVSLLSNEVSAFIICLITMDRFLVLHFPFSSLHFKARSAHATCAAVWVVAMVMAALPLTPLMTHWSFYSQSGICIPLPVTRGDFAGRHYSFGILIVCNLVLFLLIAAGQAAIYISIQTNSLSTADSTKKSNDLRIARRLITVAVSDFLCWFPIGLLGLLAFKGVPIPGEANVGMAILVLPLNSAINPFIYTVNVMLERRRRARDEAVIKHLLAQVCEEDK